jgi:hypothetical protein
MAPDELKARPFFLCRYTAEKSPEALSIFPLGILIERWRIRIDASLVVLGTEP